MGGPSRYKRSRSGSGSGFTLSRTASATAAKNVRAPSLGKVEPPHSSDVEPLSSDIEEESDERLRSPDRPRSVIEILSSPEDQKGKNKKRKEEIVFPDGEIIVIESSDEDEDVGNVTIQPMLTSTRPNSMFGGFGTPRPGGSFSAPRAVTGPMHKTASQLSFTEYRNSPRVASNGSVQSAGPSRLKRTHEFPDGEILVLSEEESVVDTDESRYTKKRRTDTETEDLEESEMETEGTTDIEGGEDEDMAFWDGKIGLSAYGSFADGSSVNHRSGAVPGHFKLSAEAGIPQTGLSREGYLEQIGNMARNAMGALNSAMQPYAGGSDVAYPNMGYHASPMNGGMPVASGSGLQRHVRESHVLVGVGAYTKVIYRRTI